MGNKILGGTKMRRDWQIKNNTKGTVYVGSNLRGLLDNAFKEKGVHDKITAKLLPAIYPMDTLNNILDTMQRLDPNGDWTGAPFEEDTLNAMIETLRRWQADDSEPYMYLYYEGMLATVYTLKDMLDE